MIADAAAPRDGKFIDVVGAFNPMLKKDDANRVKLDGEKAAWEARATAISLQDPVRARAAYDRLTESLAGLRATRQYLERQLAHLCKRRRRWCRSSMGEVLGPQHECSSLISGLSIYSDSSKNNPGCITRVPKT